METCLCGMEDLKRGRATSFRVGMKQLAVWTNGEDVVVFEPHCPHARANLIHGRYQSGTVICHWHGWQFDLKSGRGINNDSCLKILPHQVRNGRVYIQLPDPEPEAGPESDAFMPEIRWKEEE